MTERATNQKVTLLALYVAAIICWVWSRRARGASARRELRRLFREASAHPEDVEALREKMRTVIRDARPNGESSQS